MQLHSVATCVSEGFECGANVKVGNGSLQVNSRFKALCAESAGGSREQDATAIAETRRKVIFMRTAPLSDT